MKKELIKTIISIFMIISAFFLGYYFASGNLRTEIENFKKENYRVDIETAKNKLNITNNYNQIKVFVDWEELNWTGTTITLSWTTK